MHSPKLSSCVATASTALLAMCPMAFAADQSPSSRAEAIQIVADMRRIVTPNVIERLEKVRIGGIDQWVAIRGTDHRNPVLLMRPG